MNSAKCFAIGLSFAISANCFAGAVISDATFSNADWQLTVISKGSGGSVAATQAPTGGNADAYRSIANTVNPTPPGPSATVIGLHRYLPATYSPAVQGSILSIDYSEDSKLLSGFNNGQALRPALWQNGATYLTIQSLFAFQADWTTQVMAGLTQNDFFLLLPNGDSDFSRHPDFSHAGAAMGFGFERDNGTPFDRSGYTMVAGIDNWSITVTSVPESSALALMQIGVGSLLVYLRRWTAKAG